MSNLLLHILPALLVSLVLATPAFATICQERTIETANNAPVNRTGFTAAGGGGNNAQGNMSSILRVCDEDSTHEWHDAMVANGSCTPNGYEWASLATPNSAGGQPVKYTTYDGDVPDYDQRRIGIQIGNTWIGGPWQGTADNPKSCN